MFLNDALERIGVLLFGKQIGSRIRYDKGILQDQQLRTSPRSTLDIRASGLLHPLTRLSTTCIHVLAAVVLCANNKRQLSAKSSRGVRDSAGQQAREVRFSK
jgi:hypothetical protein